MPSSTSRSLEQLAHRNAVALREGDQNGKGGVRGAPFDTTKVLGVDPRLFGCGFLAELEVVAQRAQSFAQALLLGGHGALQRRAFFDLRTPVRMT